MELFGAHTSAVICVAAFAELGARGLARYGRALMRHASIDEASGALMPGAGARRVARERERARRHGHTLIRESRVIGDDSADIAEVARDFRRALPDDAFIVRHTTALEAWYSKRVMPAAGDL